MDSSKINKTYMQKGNVCVFASYSIIVNCFSKGKEEIENLIDRYISVNRIPLGSVKIEDTENAVYEHYHKVCRNEDKRGFYYIADEHSKDVYKTAKYCQVVDKDASTPYSLSEERKEELRKKLLNGGLAMVLFKNPDLGFHAIVLGYDDGLKSYFYRNPNCQAVEYEDFLKTNDIFEFIYFESSN